MRPPVAATARFVVMYGVPSGVVWDPGGDDVLEDGWIDDGLLVAATDVALALPPAPLGSRTVEAICIASDRRRAGADAAGRAGDDWPRVGGRSARERNRDVSIRPAR